eukprot:CAMPEP_0176070344 /NCGR_PEP_ID=MMETSP0120_2-20121206/35127_1 /TAXON_ID=160619 /ORGANISM="Kryptoperidinium foliaceum, Strain CCMP 1326" /LENGTH=260 /DNA_ID=CAMNT_0017403987 /DNA_START=145 /DNA_END=927 /DNA_ORIENTATION=+
MPCRNRVWLPWMAAAMIVWSAANPSTRTFAFVTTTSSWQQRTTTSPLFLAKKNTSRRRKTTNTKSSGGAGFGAAKKSETQQQSLQGKVRTISGFSGSGTKPLRQAANTFDKIREEYGKEVCWDVYVKSPLDDPDRLWFVGKVACLHKVPELAVLSQKRIILEYSKRELRPQNLGLPKYADTLELWLAPGDSELECVQNKISLQKVQGSLNDWLEKYPDFHIDQVGYNPEIYVGDEQKKGGLRITRDKDGNPIKPPFEINA